MIPIDYGIKKNFRSKIYLAASQIINGIFIGNHTFHHYQFYVAWQNLQIALIIFAVAVPVPSTIIPIDSSTLSVSKNCSSFSKVMSVIIGISTVIIVTLVLNVAVKMIALKSIPPVVNHK